MLAPASRLDKPQSRTYRTRSRCGITRFALVMTDAPPARARDTAGPAQRLVRRRSGDRFSVAARRGRAHARELRRGVERRRSAAPAVGRADLVAPRGVRWCRRAARRAGAQDLPARAAGAARSGPIPCDSCDGSGEALGRHPVRLVVPPRVQDGDRFSLSRSRLRTPPLTRVEVRVVLS